MGLCPYCTQRPATIHHLGPGVDAEPWPAHCAPCHLVADSVRDLGFAITRALVRYEEKKHG